jgi:hypothetical protein
MGYSCRKDAGDTLDRLGELLSPRAAGGPSNGFKLASGISGHWEIGREQADGSITGKVWRETGDGFVMPAGSFKISPDGKIVRFPLIPTELKRKAEQKPAMFQEVR